MISLLENVVEIISNLPEYLLYVFETALNGWFDIIQLALEAANEHLGGLPEIVSPPGYVSEINWYYPIGTLIGVATPFLTAYLVWLGISWIYRKFGAI